MENALFDANEKRHFVLSNVLECDKINLFLKQKDQKMDVSRIVQLVVWLQHLNGLEFFALKERLRQPAHVSAFTPILKPSEKIFNVLDASNLAA